MESKNSGVSQERREKIYNHYQVIKKAKPIINNIREQLDKIDAIQEAHLGVYDYSTSDECHKGMWPLERFVQYHRKKINIIMAQIRKLQHDQIKGQSVKDAKAQAHRLFYEFYELKVNCDEPLELIEPSIFWERDVLGTMLAYIPDQVISHAKCTATMHDGISLYRVIMYHRSSFASFSMRPNPYCKMLAAIPLPIEEPPETAPPVCAWVSCGTPNAGNTALRRCRELVAEKMLDVL